jgi:hypothetical protein
VVQNLTKKERANGPLASHVNVLIDCGCKIVLLPSLFDECMIKT